VSVRNEGVYLAERRSSCADCFLDLCDGIFRSRFFGAFYCFARLRDDWFWDHEFLGLFYGLRPISSQIAGLPPSRSSHGSVNRKRQRDNARARVNFCMVAASAAFWASLYFETTLPSFSVVPSGQRLVVRDVAQSFLRIGRYG